MENTADDLFYFIENENDTLTLRVSSPQSTPGGLEDALADDIDQLETNLARHLERPRPGVDEGFRDARVRILDKYAQSAPGENEYVVKLQCRATPCDPPINVAGTFLDNHLQNAWGIPGTDDTGDLDVDGDTELFVSVPALDDIPDSIKADARAFLEIPDGESLEDYREGVRSYVENFHTIGQQLASIPSVNESFEEQYRSVARDVAPAFFGDVDELVQSDDRLEDFVIGLPYDPEAFARQADLDFDDYATLESVGGADELKVYIGLTDEAEPGEDRPCEVSVELADSLRWNGSVEGFNFGSTIEHPPSTVSGGRVPENFSEDVWTNGPGKLKARMEMVLENLPDDLTDAGVNAPADDTDETAGLSP